MKILAVESSCDETAVAVVEDGRTVLTDCIASQVALHRLYGGVVPELASRKHIEAIYALADEALSRASITRQEIDAIAVTYAPGLIGAVLVGVNFAKAAAYSLGVPLVPVHHIRGHIAANYLAYPDLEPPFLCLVVSGGHTLIVDVQDYTKFRIMGTTRDDAAGECFDKIARVIGMPYPGGAALDKTAQTGDETKYPMPHTKLSGNPLDMSFSGLKTAALNLIHTHEQRGEALDIPSLCASFSKAVSDMLVPRTMQALKETGYKTLAIAGGVPHSGRVHARNTAARRPPVYAAPQPLRRQRRHDRRAGLLRIPGRKTRRAGSQRLCNDESGKRIKKNGERPPAGKTVKFKLLGTGMIRSCLFRF